MLAAPTPIRRLPPLEEPSTGPRCPMRARHAPNGPPRAHLAGLRPPPAMAAAPGAAAPPPQRRPPHHHHLLSLSDDESDDDGDVCRICRMGPGPRDPLYWPCRCSGSIKYVHQQCLLDWLTHSGRLQAGAFCEVRRAAARRGYKRRSARGGGGRAGRGGAVCSCQGVRARARARLRHARSSSLGPRPRLCLRKHPPPNPFNPQVCKHPYSFTPVYAEDAPSRLPLHELAWGLVGRAAKGVRLAHRVRRRGSGGEGRALAGRGGGGTRGWARSWFRAAGRGCGTARGGSRAGQRWSPRSGMRTHACLLASYQ